MRSPTLHLPILQLDHLPVLDHGNILRWHAHFLGQHGVLFQMAQLAVDGDEVFGLHQVQQQLHLLLAGVPGDVHRGDGLVDHVGAAPEQAVDRAVDALLVAGDGVRGEHDGIALA